MVSARRKWLAETVSLEGVVRLRGAPKEHSSISCSPGPPLILAPDPFTPQPASNFQVAETSAEYQTGGSKITESLVFGARRWAIVAPAASGVGPLIAL